MGRSKFMKDNIGTIVILLIFLASSAGVAGLVIVLVLIGIPMALYLETKDKLRDPWDDV